MKMNVIESRRFVDLLFSMLKSSFETKDKRDQMFRLLKDFREEDHSKSKEEF